jgi:tetratricopeptide (TPR) repeat protein/transcriptional regulator with XRE-family HTH domain
MASTPPKPFGALLKAYRQDAGLSQPQLAEAAGLSVDAISTLERGKRLKPHPDTVARILAALAANGVDPSKQEHLREAARLQREADVTPASTEPSGLVAPHLRALPYPRNPFFLGREDLLARLHRHLHAGQAKALSQPPAFSGLGGVGKTQVALEYAYRHADEYQAIFWIRADSREALLTGFLEIAQTLKLPERGERDQAGIVAAVKRWLLLHPGWLLILDNADELALLPEFLPAPLPGHLLLTTRAQALGGLASRLEVETLDQDTGPLLLLRRAGLLALDAPLAQAEQTDWQAAVQLSQELGGLPLALDQAGAYLEETRCSLQQYLHLYRSHRADLLRHRGGMVQDHPESVATTWSLSFAQVEQRSPLAADLLRLCAWLHPDAIPEELFLQGAAHLGPLLSTLATDPLAFNQALAIVQHYSLLRRSSRENMLSIHRLVQAVLQDAMPQEEREQWIGRAIAALHAIFPAVRDQGWGQWESSGRLLPHVLSLTAATATRASSMELATVLVLTADYLYQRAQYAEAEPLYRRALETCEQTPGASHSQVAFPLSGLAELHRAQGRYAEAEPLFIRALRLWEQVGHGDHPDLAYTLNNLAILYCEQGHFQQAEPLFARAIGLWGETRDPRPAQLASALNNLASLHLAERHFEQAEPLLRRALHLEEELFGPSHPEVAFPLTNLATLYYEQGRYAEAEPLYRRALEMREQTLGSTHPQVTYPLQGLADLCREQGRYTEAEQFYQRALLIQRQHRGAHHPETAETLHGYARLLELQHQPERALTCYQQALAIREQHLGKTHPDAQETRTRYARLLSAQGRAEEAAALETRSIQPPTTNTQAPLASESQN